MSQISYKLELWAYGSLVLTSTMQLTKYKNFMLPKTWRGYKWWVMKPNGCSWQKQVQPGRNGVEVAQRAPTYCKECWRSEGWISLHKAVYWNQTAASKLYFLLHFIIQETHMHKHVGTKFYSSVSRPSLSQSFQPHNSPVTQTSSPNPSAHSRLPFS